MVERELRFIVHHVGGRSGSRSFPVLSAFDADIVNVMYEADQSCLPQIAEQWQRQPSRTLVLRHCLSSREGFCTFRVNYDPYTSSVLPPNPRYAQFYHPQPGYDYVFGDVMRPMATVELPTTTLDAVVLDRHEAPAPDFLSVD